MTELARYLHEVAGRECALGELDCAVLMADWAMRCGFPDPMPDRRGTYATERAYRAAVRSEGGLVSSCRRRFARSGLQETEMPLEGDVVLALAPFAWRRGRPLSRPVGGIMLQAGLIAVLDWPRGIIGARMPVIAAWRCSHG